MKERKGKEKNCSLYRSETNSTKYGESYRTQFQNIGYGLEEPSLVPSLVANPDSL